jgi:hypothetical protein
MRSRDEARDPLVEAGRPEVRNLAANDTNYRKRADRLAMPLSLEGSVPMTITLGILALLEAKAGKGDELAAFP